MSNFKSDKKEKAGSVSLNRMFFEDANYDLDSIEKLSSLPGA